MLLEVYLKKRVGVVVYTRNGTEEINAHKHEEPIDINKGHSTSHNQVLLDGLLEDGRNWCNGRNKMKRKGRRLKTHTVCPCSFPARVQLSCSPLQLASCHWLRLFLSLLSSETNDKQLEIAWLQQSSKKKNGVWIKLPSLAHLPPAWLPVPVVFSSPRHVVYGAQHHVSCAHRDVSKKKLSKFNILLQLAIKQRNPRKNNNFCTSVKPKSEVIRLRA